MPRPRFGTDGLRGVANADLSAPLALALGRAVARLVPSTTFVVGRDTRRSGPLLQAAFSAGIATEGADVIDLGVLPTPGVAALCRRRGVPGAVISASHNPFGDNGIKLIGADGMKLSDELEAAIDDQLDAVIADPEGGPRRPTGLGIGRLLADPAGAEEYRDQLIAQFAHTDFGALSVVMDCANGAASTIGPEVLEELGLNVVSINNCPDGANINDGCGSTVPEHVAEQVVAKGADLGLALDGDADRLVAVDDTGNICSGDELMGLFASDLSSRGKLAGNTVVLTVMANLGLRRALEAQGIAIRETPVGDRYVLAAMEAEGLSLGGEQSGHLIFRPAATTGDGIFTAVSLCELVVRSGRSLTELTSGLFERVPQVLINVAVAPGSDLARADDVWAVVAQVQAQLGSDGRVLVRPSGTEPLVRVMVEAPGENQANDLAWQLQAVIASALG